MVKEPRLSFSRRALDFGPGFYTTTDLQQATRWAVRVAKARQEGEPVVIAYSCDNVRWSELSILQFDGPDREWLRTVAGYRSGATVEDHVYDVIAGPVADDRTIDVINRYLEGGYSEEIALQLLLPFRYTDQWALKTAQALSALVHEEVLYL